MSNCIYFFQQYDRNKEKLPTLMNTNILRILGAVWMASGAKGTFGEGYKIDRLKRLGLMCHWFITFVAKTVTAEKNEGNTPLEEDGFSVKHWIPKSIYITFFLWWKKACLNCFGLSNGGIEAALSQTKFKRWQDRTKPFMLSFMPVGDKSTWLAQTRKFVDALLQELPSFRAQVALQFNSSCPNTGNNPLELAPFITQIFDILEELDIPILLKINAEFPIPLAKEISLHPACSGFVMGNTLPFGSRLPEGWPQVDWIGLFGTDKPEESPLALRFEGDPKKAGGLSGAPLLPIVCHWIAEAREAGITCHINAGGGINSPRDVSKVWLAGADSISLGTISMFRPWIMLPTTLFAHFLFRLLPRK